MNNYVSIAYRQDKKPLGLFCLVASSGEDARRQAIDALPPIDVLTHAGCVEVWLVTRVLTHATWPNCHREGCPNKASPTPTQVYERD